jgi:hypothetical protein
MVTPMAAKPKRSASAKTSAKTPAGSALAAPVAEKPAAKKPAVKLPPVDAKTLGQIVDLANRVADSAVKRRDPQLEIPARTLSNVRFNKARKIIEMGGQTNSRQLFNLSQAKSYMQTLLVATGCKALIDQQKNEGGLGMVDADAAGEGLEKNRLSSAGRGGDEASLAHTQRSDEIDGARCEFGVPWCFQKDAAVGEKRCEFVELQRGLPLAGGNVFDE